jgi:hypothetical protein
MTGIRGVERSVLFSMTTLDQWRAGDSVFPSANGFILTTHGNGGFHQLRIDSSSSVTAFGVYIYPRPVALALDGLLAFYTTTHCPRDPRMASEPR